MSPHINSLYSEHITAVTRLDRPRLKRGTESATGTESYSNHYRPTHPQSLRQSQWAHNRAFIL